MPAASNDAGRPTNGPCWTRRRQRSSGQSMAWATDLYLAGDDGTILRTADAARTWVDVSVAPASVGATIQYPRFYSNRGERGRRRLGGRKNVTHVGCSDAHD